MKNVGRFVSSAAAATAAAASLLLDRPVSTRAERRSLGRDLGHGRGRASPARPGRPRRSALARRDAAVLRSGAAGADGRPLRPPAPATTAPARRRRRRGAERAPGPGDRAAVVEARVAAADAAARHAAQLQQSDAAPDRPHEPRRRSRPDRPEQCVRHVAAAVGAAHVALREKDAAIVGKSDRVVTFGGSPSVNIPPGAIGRQRSGRLTVPAFADLAIDLYLPGDTAASTSPLTTHDGALQTNYVSATGNHAGRRRSAGRDARRPRGSSWRASRSRRPSRPAPS